MACPTLRRSLTRLGSNRLVLLRLAQPDTLGESVDVTRRGYSPRCAIVRVAHQRSAVGGRRRLWSGKTHRQSFRGCSGLGCCAARQSVRASVQADIDKQRGNAWRAARLLALLRSTSFRRRPAGVRGDAAKSLPAEHVRRLRRQWLDNLRLRPGRRRPRPLPRPDPDGQSQGHTEISRAPGASTRVYRGSCDESLTAAWRPSMRLRREPSAVAGRAEQQRDPRRGRVLLSRWLSGKGAGGAGGTVVVGGGGGGSRGLGPFQALAAAVRWLWILSRLCVAAANRHSERAADLPRRWKRSIPRLNLSCPNTGSTVAWRFR